MFLKLFVHLTVMLTALASGYRTRTAHVRGANFIEYALLAVIAVILFGVFSDSLKTAFAEVYTRIEGALKKE